MQFGLNTFNEIKIKSGKKMAILADMGELENPEEEHEKIGKLLATLNIDYVFCIGNYQLLTYQEALREGVSKDKIFWFPNVFEAYKTVEQYMKKGTYIYLKGSLYKRIDRVFGLIKGIKPHCNVKNCPLYNPSFTCKPLHCTIPNHIHHDDTHE
jgi:UDP-N-acetylmuramyl pentapeptide synthase